MRVELFTSLECHAESNQLRDWLTTQGISFREVDLTARPGRFLVVDDTRDDTMRERTRKLSSEAFGSRPTIVCMACRVSPTVARAVCLSLSFSLPFLMAPTDYHTQLLQRFGADFTVPGILWNDSEWFGWSSSSSTNQDDDSNQEMADSHGMDPARHPFWWTRLQQRLHESAALVETTVPQQQPQDDGSGSSSSSSTCSTRSSLPSNNKNNKTVTVVGTVDPPGTPSTPGSSTPQRATTLPDQRDSHLVDGTPHKNTTTKDNGNEDNDNEDGDKTSDRRRFPKDTHPMLLVGRDHDSFVWWGTSLATLNSTNTPIPPRSNATTKHHKAHRRNSASELLAMMNDPNEKGRPFSGISLDDESEEEEEEEEEQETGPDMDPTPVQFPTTLSPSSTSTTSKSTQTPHDEEPSQAFHHSTVVQGASPSFSAGKVTVSSSCLWVQRQALLLPLVPLPNGKHVTVAALTRLLLQGTYTRAALHTGI